MVARRESKMRGAPPKTGASACNGSGGLGMTRSGDLLMLYGLAGREFIRGVGRNHMKQALGRRQKEWKRDKDGALGSLGISMGWLLFRPVDPPSPGFLQRILLR